MGFDKTCKAASLCFWATVFLCADEIFIGEVFVPRLLLDDINFSGLSEPQVGKVLV